MWCCTVIFVLDKEIRWSQSAFEVVPYWHSENCKDILLYEGRGCRKSPAQARKFWKKAADAGDVAAWVALGDDAMVQGKGAGAALRAYRKAQKLCASTPDIAYMPQVCLRVAQYETQYISRKKALAQLAEAKQGFLVRKEEGDETAQSWLDETEAVIRQLLERE